MICEAERLGKETVRMSLRAPEIAERVQAGQYLILMTGETAERIPLTAADWDREKGTVTVLFRIEGPSTERLSGMKPGDKLSHLLGPLGTPTELGGVRRALIAASGMGCTAAHAHLKALTGTGALVSVLVADGGDSPPVLAEEMKRLAPVETVSERGLCDAVLKRSDGVDLLLVFGPAAMMKAVAGATRGRGVRMVAGLRPFILDGTGLCGGCRVRVDGKYRFACVDGPQFDGHAVDFDELMTRNGPPSGRDRHPCRLGIGRD